MSASDLFFVCNILHHLRCNRQCPLLATLVRCPQMGFFRRNLKISTSNIKEKAFIHPLLEYAASLWDPYSQKNIAKIEAVQRRVACFILNRFRNTLSVNNMLDALGWPTLEQWRQTCGLSMLYKIQWPCTLPNAESQTGPPPIMSTTNPWQTVHTADHQNPVERLLLPPKNHQGLELITHGTGGGPPPPTPPLTLSCQGYQTEQLPTVTPLPPVPDFVFLEPVQQTPPVIGARIIDTLIVGP